MTAKPRLLVVDDEAGIRESLSLILKDEGYQVEAVASAEEALVRALAVDFGPSGIRVNSLTPGLVQTPLAYVDRPDFDDQIEAIAAR